jgi:hypothetical protein
MRGGGETSPAWQCRTVVRDTTTSSCLTHLFNEPLRFLVNGGWRGGRRAGVCGGEQVPRNDRALAVDRAPTRPGACRGGAAARAPGTPPPPTPPPIARAPRPAPRVAHARAARGRRGSCRSSSRQRRSAAPSPAPRRHARQAWPRCARPATAAPGALTRRAPSPTGQPTWTPPSGAAGTARRLPPSPPPPPPSLPFPIRVPLPYLIGIRETLKSITVPPLRPPLAAPHPAPRRRAPARRRRAAARFSAAVSASCVLRGAHVGCLVRSRGLSCPRSRGLSCPRAGPCGARRGAIRRHARRHGAPGASLAARAGLV